VNNLPKVVTRQRGGRGSNSRSLSHQSDALATRLSSQLVYLAVATSRSILPLMRSPVNWLFEANRQKASSSKTTVELIFEINIFAVFFLVTIASTVKLKVICCNDIV